jgi:hypothetical protein
LGVGYIFAFQYFCFFAEQSSSGFYLDSIAQTREYQSVGQECGDIKHGA